MIIGSLYGDGPHPLALAHRGGAGLEPENTLQAFSRAVDLGFSYLETDVQVTSDGVVVAFHDEDLRRVTGRPGLVARTSWDDVRGLRVLGGGTVPRIEEVLASFPWTRLTIDVKDPRAFAPLLRVLRETGSVDRVCLAGTWDRRLVAARTELPGLATALGWGPLARLVSSAHCRVPRRMMSGGQWAPFAHVPLRLGRFPVFAHAITERAHELGVRVVVWTVNDAVTMRRLLDAGVDGIITDRPDVLREVLISRGQWRSGFTHGLDPALLH